MPPKQKKIVPKTRLIKDAKVTVWWHGEDGGWCRATVVVRGTANGTVTLRWEESSEVSKNIKLTEAKHVASVSEPMQDSQVDATNNVPHWHLGWESSVASSDREESSESSDGSSSGDEEAQVTEDALEEAQVTEDELIDALVAHHEAQAGSSTRPPPVRATILRDFLATNSALHARIVELTRLVARNERRGFERAAKLARNALAFPSGDVKHAMHRVAREEASAALADGDVIPYPRRKPDPTRNKPQKTHRDCFNYAFVTGVACAGNREGRRSAAVAVSAADEEALRRQGKSFYGDCFRLNGPHHTARDALTRRAICMPCLRAHHGGQGSLILLGGGNVQCECCREVRSSGYGRINADGWCHECKVPQVEGDGIITFLDQLFKPMIAVAANQPVRMDFHQTYNTMSIPTYGNADLLVTLKVDGAVVSAIVVEIDTQQHSGKTDDGARVIATLFELRALYPKAKIGVIHFNVRDTARQSIALQKAQEAQRRKRQAKRVAEDFDASVRSTGTDDDKAPTKDDDKAPTKNQSKDKRDVHKGRDMTAAQRWQLLRAWLLFIMVLHPERFPRVIALYLCYDDDNELIVWPIGNGVCGCTSRAPKVDDMHAADWGGAPGLSVISRALDRGDRTLAPNCLKADVDVFGKLFGPDARTNVHGL